MTLPAIRSGSTTTVQGGAASTSASFTWPSGGNAPAANDIALIALASDQDNSWSWPSGNEIAEVQQGGAGTGTVLGLCWIRCTGSESGSFTVTLANSRTWTISMTLYQNCITSGTPYEDLNSNQGTSTTPTSTAIDTTAADRLGVIVTASREGWVYATDLSAGGWTQQFELGVTNLPSMALDTKNIASATTEAAVNRTESNVTWVTFSLALLPVPPASTFRPYLIHG